MSAYDQFLTDKDLESSGVLIDYGDFSLTIARAGGANKAFNKTLESLSRPYRKQIQAGRLSREVQDDLMLKAFARSVVKTWEGMTDAEGASLPFNEENFIKVMKDLPDLWEDIQGIALGMEAFRKEVREEEAGNS